MENKNDVLVKFFYEIGNLRKVLRAHQQALLVVDPTDNIASHSFRTAFIGYFLAKELKADADKVLKMCLLHDMEEVRSGDMNWVNKKYVKVFGDEIRDDQLEGLPHSEEFLQLSKEYTERQSKEAKIAKDADLLEQIFLLKEYAHQGNKEAEKWLNEDGQGQCQQIKLMNFDLTRDIAKRAIEGKPSDWWKDIWTSKNR
ncbi:MAG: HD domain-containing protein [Candidatus Pacebacteria bacterium]|nr:HD domain-containing protein [Candidatus Paceibacterota bacterium]